MDAFEAISLPEPSSTAGQRCFSPAQANRALVLVRRIVTDIVRDYRKLCELHRAFQTLDVKGSPAAEAEEARHRYVRLTDHLSELRDELEEIGCELKDYDMGLVDFPSVRDGREILLCWKLGEENVEHWHELEAGFSDRRRISDES